MSSSRREFIKKAALATGGTGLLGALPTPIQKAMGISADYRTTFLDAGATPLLVPEIRL